MQRDALVELLCPGHGSDASTIKTDRSSSPCRTGTSGAAGRTRPRGRSRHGLPVWVQRFTPLLIKAARPCRHRPGERWFVDEAYVKVAGRWTCLYRAVDQHCQVIDVLARERRDQAAAQRFFVPALSPGAPAGRGHHRQGLGPTRASSTSSCTLARNIRRGHYELQGVGELGHEVGKMIAWEPLPHVRREQRLPRPLHRQEVVRHGAPILYRPGTGESLPTIMDVGSRRSSREWCYCIRERLWSHKPRTYPAWRHRRSRLFVINNPVRSLRRSATVGQCRCARFMRTPCEGQPSPPEAGAAWVSRNHSLPPHRSDG